MNKHGLFALSGLVLALGKGQGHAPAECIPLRWRDLGSNAAIGDDFDLPLGEEDVEQDAAVFFGMADAELSELFFRPLPCRQAAL